MQEVPFPEENQPEFAAIWLLSNICFLNIGERAFFLKKIDKKNYTCHN
jgi:hypothetical protein